MHVSNKTKIIYLSLIKYKYVIQIVLTIELYRIIHAFNILETIKGNQYNGIYRISKYKTSKYDIDKYKYLAILENDINVKI